MRGHVGALALLSVAALVFDLGGFGALAALGDGGGRGRNADAEHGEAPPPAERASVARPDEVTVVVECALGPKGAFDVVVVPSWAPLGAARFLALVDDSFFDGAAMFRAVERFLVQFGISADRDLNVKWTNQRMTDDPKLGVRIGRGTLAFAGGGKDSRAMQMFIALSDHSWPHLGKEPWESPFAYIPLPDYERVIAQLNTEYGDMKPFNNEGVDVGRIWEEGNDYLRREFPRIDYLTYCKRKEVAAAAAAPATVPAFPTEQHFGLGEAQLEERVADEDFAAALYWDTTVLYAVACGAIALGISICLCLLRRPDLKQA